MKLIASLAPARAEIEAGVVAKADQYGVLHIYHMLSAAFLPGKSIWVVQTKTIRSVLVGPKSVMNTLYEAIKTTITCN